MRNIENPEHGYNIDMSDIKVYVNVS